MKPLVVITLPGHSTREEVERAHQAAQARLPDRVVLVVSEGVTVVETDHRALLSLTIATYARTVGLTRAEASLLMDMLTYEDMPATVDQAWAQLDSSCMTIRKNRRPKC